MKPDTPTPADSPADEKFVNLRHPLYSTWLNMKQRCNNPNNHSYEYYGGRGIKICDRWNNSDGFKLFVKDMGAKPPGYTLDRIDTNKGYTPKNCRWASQQLQSINKFRSRSNAGIIGIKYVQARDKFQAHVTYYGDYIFLGIYKKLDDAIIARKTAIKVLERIEHEAGLTPAEGTIV